MRMLRTLWMLCGSSALLLCVASLVCAVAYWVMDRRADTPTARTIPSPKLRRSERLLRMAVRSFLFIPDVHF